LRRPSPGQWEPDGRPEYLRQQAIKSREKLGLKQIALWQLHRIDPRVPRDEQFSAVKSLQDEGIIRHAGLSNVSVEEIEAASEIFKLATVQNRYNLLNTARVGAVGAGVCSCGLLLARVVEVSGTIRAMMLSAVKKAAPEPTAAIIAPTRNRSCMTRWLDAISVRLMYANNELSRPANAPEPNTNIAQVSLRGSDAD
jgi:Aldo/keto reductase family